MLQPCRAIVRNPSVRLGLDSSRYVEMRCCSRSNNNTARSESRLDLTYLETMIGHLPKDKKADTHPVGVSFTDVKL